MNSLLTLSYGAIGSLACLGVAIIGLAIIIVRYYHNKKK